MRNMEEVFNNIISFILSPTFPDWVKLIKFVFVILSFFFIGFIIWALIKTTWLYRLLIWDIEEILTYRPFGVRKIVRQWQKIKSKLDTGLESEYKLAVLKADAMLDLVLARMGFGGKTKTLGERLVKLTAASLPNIEEVKQAHKVRNNIVHDPAYRLSLDEAKKVIEAYGKALTDLQAL